MLKTTVWRCAPKLAGLAVVLAMCLGPARASAGDGKGAVYMMTNAADGNQLAVFARDNQGNLEFPVFYNTGDDGAGAGLGSQGSIALNAAGNVLYLVNAGSGSISVFDLSKKEPDLIQIISSGGTFPNSVTVSGNFLYVLNAGGAHGAVDMITGFKVDAKGKLTALANSTQALSAPSVEPAEVLFSPNGNWLVVTERSGNNIDVFEVLANGTTSAPTFTPTPLPDAFGFVFSSNGYLVTTFGNNGAPPGAVGSYQILNNGTTEVITPTLDAGTQLGTCWCAITANQKYIFTVNTASATVSAFGFDSNTGTLTLLNPVGGGGLAGILPSGGPTDITILNSSVIYVNASGSGQIVAFTIGKGGSLDELFVSPVGVMPKSAAGLVVQ